METSKKLLVLATKSSTNKNAFVSGITSKLPSEVQVQLADFEDIIIDIESKNISVTVSGVNILDYDLVYFRRAGKAFMWLAAAVATFLDSQGKKYFDTTYKEVGPFANKFYAFLKLALAGLPVVPSIVVYKENMEAKKAFIIERLGFPMVFKDPHAQRGLGVSLIKDSEEFDKAVAATPSKKLMFQKFIVKKDEYRVLVLKDGIGCFERKVATDPNEFRNNVSLGAREEFLKIEDMPEDLKEVAITAAAKLKIEIAGVDIVVDEDGKYHLLEVNRGPGLTYKDPASPEIENLAKFFVKELE